MVNPKKERDYGGNMGGSRLTCVAFQWVEHKKCISTGVGPCESHSFIIMVNRPPKCVRLSKCIPRGQESEMLYHLATEKLNEIIKAVMYHPPSHGRVRAVKLLLDTAMQSRGKECLWRKFLYSSLEEWKNEVLPQCLLFGLFMGVGWLCGKLSRASWMLLGACMCTNRRHLHHEIWRLYGISRV